MSSWLAQPSAGVLEPGARLVERDLCEQLQVSRTSLREALGELQAEGILTYSPTRRLSVSVISRTDAENAYRIRAVMEALVVECQHFEFGVGVR